MTGPTVRVFAGILERESQWQRLSGSAMGVAAIYTLMLLGAIFASGEQAPPKRRLRDELVVTLLDLPKISELRMAEDSGGAPGEDTGGPQAAGLVLKTSKKETGRPKPASTPLPSPKAKPLPNPKSQSDETPKGPIGAAVQPEPQRPSPAPKGEANAPPTQLVTPNSNTSSGPGPAGGLGTGSAGGTAGITGAGAGTGSGSGARPGVASGDATVLPFMDGMTRPALVSKVDPEYTREARDASVAGLILTKCVITTEGRLQRCRIVKGIPLMDQAVLAALSRWRYSPVMYQGKPTAVEYVIPVRLVLP